MPTAPFAQIVAETPVAGYVAPVFEIVSAGRGRRTPTPVHGGPGEPGGPGGAGTVGDGTVFQLPPRTAWSPAISVFDTGDAFVVIAELAGVGPDSLRIELDEATDTLTLCGSRLGFARATAEDVDAVDEEVASGRFERTVTFDQPVNSRGARAVCRYGLLELLVPKRRTRTPRRAPVVVRNRKRSVAC